MRSRRRFLRSSRVARLASVTPSCVDDRVRDRSLEHLSATRAFRFPCLTSSSRRVFLTFTIENSAATNEAFSENKHSRRKEEQSRV